MLTSVQNPLVKQIRKLHRAKERQLQQQFLLEGTHLLEEACALDYPLLTVCYTEAWQATHETLWNHLNQQSDRMILVSPNVLESIATTVQPDGIVAIAPRQPSEPSSTDFGPLTLALETLQDPGNLGTIIRTAAAVGVSRLWLSGDSVDLDHPKVLRASAGQWFRQPMATCPDLVELTQQAKQQKIQIIATRPTATLTYWDVDWRQPSLILLGNEGAGLSENLMDLADVQVTIPLAAGVESLNVAIAAALILYEAKRQNFQPCFSVNRA